MNKKTLVYLAYLVAALLSIVAVIYFVTPANQLPSFMPGHDISATKVHFKHGLGALFLALASVAFAWFQGGPKSAQK